MIDRQVKAEAKHDLPIDHCGEGVRATSCWKDPSDWGITLEPPSAVQSDPRHGVGQSLDPIERGDPRDCCAQHPQQATEKVQYNPHCRGSHEDYPQSAYACGDGHPNHWTNFLSLTKQIDDAQQRVQRDHFEEHHRYQSTDDEDTTQARGADQAERKVPHPTDRRDLLRITWIEEVIVKIMAVTVCAQSLLRLAGRPDRISSGPIVASLWDVSTRRAAADVRSAALFARRCRAEAYARDSIMAPTPLTYV